MECSLDLTCIAFLNQVLSTSFVPNSSQVLGSVKNRIEAFAASHDDFPAMLRKAQQYLVARGKVDWTDTPAAVPPLRRSDSLGEHCVCERVAGFLESNLAK